MQGLYFRKNNMDMVQKGYTVVLVDAGDIIIHKGGFETPVSSDSFLISRADWDKLLQANE